MHSISVDKALSLLKSDQAILVDVREPDEFKQEHIAYAKSVPLSQIGTVFDQLQLDDTKPVLFQCQKGMRGQKACDLIQELEHYRGEVINLEGGIESWKAAGYPTIVSGAKTAGISLMRQVQITLGALIVVFISLGFMGLNAGFVLAGIIGGALCFSGITGWCGLALLLAKMPWNR